MAARCPTHVASQCRLRSLTEGFARHTPAALTCEGAMAQAVPNYAADAQRHVEVGESGDCVLVHEPESEHESVLADSGAHFLDSQT